MGRAAGDIPVTVRALLRDRTFLLILLFALALRIGIACWPVIHHPDEVWQYLEPAYHLAVGPWVMTWEARAGARSWLLPMLFAGPTAIGQILAPGSGLSIFLPRLVCVGISFATVIGAMALGARISRAHALIATLVAATWFEVAYFAPRTLSEPIATACFVAAAAALLPGRAPRWTVIGGALIGACCVVRFQYAPAAAVLAIAAGWIDPRRWGLMALGGSAALAVSAVADLAGGAWPFLWIVHNFTLNLVDNRSASFGVDPWWRYLIDIWDLWGWATMPITALALVGARRYPALFIAAVANLAVHALVPHKEYRFILLTTTVFVLLAAIGSVDALRRMKAKADRVGWIGAAWISASIICGATGAATTTFGQNAELMAGWRLAGAQRHACGIAVYRPRDVIVGSYALFGRSVPIYQYGDADRSAAQTSQAFDLLLTSSERATDLPAYRLVGCPSNDRQIFCVYARPGRCTPTASDAPFDINALFERNGF